MGFKSISSRWAQAALLAAGLVAGMLGLSSCLSQAPGRLFVTTWQGGKKVRTEYSEYFEYDETILDGKVRMHLLITLGPERVFANRLYPLAIEANPFDARRRAASLDEVVEIYFTNLSDTPLSFSPLELKIMPYGTMWVKPCPIALAPGQYVKTEPFLGASGGYMPLERDFSFHYAQADDVVWIEGKLRRLQVDALKLRREMAGQGLRGD